MTDEPQQTARPAQLIPSAYSGLQKSFLGHREHCGYYRF